VERRDRAGEDQPVGKPHRSPRFVVPQVKLRSREDPHNPRRAAYAPAMRDKLPQHLVRFRKAHPSIYDAFEELGRRVHEEGSLSERERRLVKIGIAMAAGTEGGVHSAVRHAIAGGCTREDVEHAIRLGITTLGWPRTMAALSWIDDVYEQP
jgi:4-carboxymuconolactone decarboxylase